MRVVDDLIRHGRVIRARAGWRVRDLTDAERSAHTGVRITAISPSGSAERAGLKPGDLVTAVGERRIVRSSDLKSAIELHRPGDRIEVRVTRSDGARVVQLKLDGPRS